MNILDKNSKIYVAGHNGLVGSAIVRELRKRGFDVSDEIYTIEKAKEELLKILSISS